MTILALTLSDGIILDEKDGIRRTVTFGPVRHSLQDPTNFVPLKVPSLDIIALLKIDSENEQNLIMEGNLDARKRGKFIFYYLNFFRLYKRIVVKPQLNSNLPKQ